MTFANRVSHFIVAAALAAFAWSSPESARADQPAPIPAAPPAGPASPANSTSSPAPAVAPPVSAQPAPAPGNSAFSPSVPAPVAKPPGLSPAAGGIVTDSHASQANPGPRQKNTLFEPQTIEFKDNWAKFRTSEYVVTGIQIVLAIGAHAIPGAQRWVGKNALDDKINKAIGAKTIDGQRLARDVSDGALVMMVNQRLIDDVFVAWWYHGKGSVGFQLGLMDAEALSFSLAVQGIVSGAVGRPRPYKVGPDCSRPIEKDTLNCNSSNEYRSFFSGHSTAAFTMAGLTCMHHAYLPLYGNKVADALACVGTLGAASTIAMMRVVGDQHNFTDVLTGAAVGTLSGLGFPWLFHYRGGGSPSQPDPVKPTTVTATVIPGPTGITVLGAF